MKKLVLIDGHSILNRAFYGLPDLTNSEGKHTGAVYGFLNIMFRIIEDEKPDHLMVAFDEHAPTFRHEMYKEYKGTRKPMPEELREQVPLMREMLTAMNIRTLSIPGLEADDILGTAAKRAEEAGSEVALISGDRDLLQIASEHIKIRIPKTKRGGTEIEDYYEKDVKAAYGLTPLQFIELKALMGDTADNIPGVPKVGEKTALSLMQEYGSIDNIYAHIEDISKNAIRESLRENRELADLSLKLATINTACDLGIKLEEDTVYEDPYTAEAYELCKRLDFKAMLSKFENKGTAVTALEYAFRSVGEADFIKVVNDAEGLDLMIYPLSGDRIIAVLGTGEDTAIGLETTAVSAAAEAIRSSVFAGKKTVTSEVKRLYSLLYGRTAAPVMSCVGEQMSFEQLLNPEEPVEEGYALKLSREAAANIRDVLIEAYLLNPLKSDMQIADMIKSHTGGNPESYDTLFGKKSFEEALNADKERFLKYAAMEASSLSSLDRVMSERLTEQGMDRIFEDMEMPLSYVLYCMEREGIQASSSALKEYGKELKDRLDELEKKIYEAAGEEFNINSPKQLAVILFEKMGLQGGKKTKTGYSTSADVLEKLAGDVPFVRDILEYRTYAKLKSTYADGLDSFIAADGRIHTKFNQTVTATGRLSSTDPNLQNIPMRTELGRRIRKVFTPKEGCIFTDADYSQIELRILASLAGDEGLIEAYKEGRDIHRITAAKVFGVPFEEVTDLQRRNAKAVNFGIVYGISSFGLSQDLSISRSEAKEYIEQYFITYPGIKAYLDRVKEEAKEKGYSVTYFGRRRPIPELASNNFMQRQFGERVAMNAPVQGTAADIMKIAMINVFDRIVREGLRSRLLLQIHDELLIETYEDEKAAVTAILSEEMKKAADLPVELETDVHTGTDWYEAK
ncbi:MAG: DNA polymerase I [Lachnospiraceae bacterium]|nr:DNA polymerase I [Lachnospiraceae bacterium]